MENFKENVVPMSIAVGKSACILVLIAFFFWNFYLTFKASSSGPIVPTYFNAAMNELNYFVACVNDKCTYHLTDDQGNEIILDSEEEADKIIQKKADDIAAKRAKDRAKRDATTAFNY